MCCLPEPFMEAEPASPTMHKPHLRCFFNLVNGHETIRDEIGVEVPDLATARDQAHSAIDELRQEYDGDTENWSGWRLEVVCSEGKLLYSADLNTGRME